MIRTVKIEALPNGAHDNLEVESLSVLEEGWAIIPEDMETPNFPFGELEVADVDGVMTVTKWTQGEIPEPDPLTPSQQREEAYNTQAVIEWDGEMITVTEASQKWQYYAAEGSEKADELTARIASAKQDIREMHPDSAEGIVNAM